MKLKKYRIEDSRAFANELETRFKNIRYKRIRYVSRVVYTCTFRHASLVIELHADRVPSYSFAHMPYSRDVKTWKDLRKLAKEENRLHEALHILTIRSIYE